MMILFAAALAAAAPAAPAQHDDAQHDQQMPADHATMDCCKHMKADSTADCCKDVDAAEKAGEGVHEDK